MIQFRAVTKKYKNDHYALKNVNLDILSGEFVFMIMLRTLSELWGLVQEK